MKTFKEIYEARVVDVAQRKKAAIRMSKMAKSSAFQKKKERASMKVRSSIQLYVAARKSAIKKLRTKKYPKYDELSIQSKVKIDQVFMQKFGKVIDKMAKKLTKVLRSKEIERIKQAKIKKENEKI
jgi:hypothetical protein|tara:strand:+ start:135 stop:512 length:378 start_codon:yes stop_codon:yes gene_type:complete